MDCVSLSERFPISSSDLGSMSTDFPVSILFPLAGYGNHDRVGLRLIFNVCSGSCIVWDVSFGAGVHMEGFFFYRFLYGHSYANIF